LPEGGQGGHSQQKISVICLNTVAKKNRGANLEELSRAAAFKTIEEQKIPRGKGGKRTKGRMAKGRRRGNLGVSQIMGGTVGRQTDEEEKYMTGFQKGTFEAMR